MSLTPTQVAGASFRVVRKGYDPEEVDAFLQRTAKVLEAAQQQATSMEARARAAVAKLQEITAEQQAAAPVAKGPARAESEKELDAPAAPAPTPAPAPAGEEVETISRTLLLAQRTADQTVAEAQAEAERLRSEAQAEAERLRTEAKTEADSTLDSTREMSAQLLEDAKVEARKVSDAERAAAEAEVRLLTDRRESLELDVEQLDRFLSEQRERMRAAARQIEAMCERVPAGLGPVSPPRLAGGRADADPDATREMPTPVIADEVDAGA